MIFSKQLLHKHADENPGAIRFKEFASDNLLLLATDTAFQVWHVPSVQECDFLFCRKVPGVEMMAYLRSRH